MSKGACQRASDRRRQHNRARPAYEQRVTWATDGSAALHPQAALPPVTLTLNKFVLCEGLIQVIRQTWHFSSHYVVLFAGKVVEWSQAALMDFWWLYYRLKIERWRMENRGKSKAGATASDLPKLLPAPVLPSCPLLPERVPSTVTA